MNARFGGNVLVTGGSGFLGKAVVRRLQVAGATVYAPSSELVNLLSPGALTRYISRAREKEDIDVVVHLAGMVGGIGAVSRNPYSFMFNNLMMGINAVNDSIMAGVDRIIYSNSVCSYPKEALVPTDEGQYWLGYPEETNAPYGLAKKAVGELLFAAHAQYGIKVANLVLANMYGPGDNFDPATGHVIPSLFRKLHKARGVEDKMVLWGTGKPTRDFLYVHDAADAIYNALDINEPGVLNVSSGRETSISEIANSIAAIVGFDGEVEFDATSPDGQPRRSFTSEKFSALTGWSPRHSLLDGLMSTYAWFVENVA